MEDELEDVRRKLAERIYRAHENILFCSSQVSSEERSDLNAELVLSSYRSMISEIALIKAYRELFKDENEVSEELRRMESGLEKISDECTQLLKRIINIR